jgi:radical SAM protein with 4Fe4S-binding SPASM domain
VAGASQPLFFFLGWLIAALFGHAGQFRWVAVTPPCGERHRQTVSTTFTISPVFWGKFMLKAILARVLDKGKGSRAYDRKLLRSTFARYLGRGWYGVEDGPRGPIVWSKNVAEIKITPNVTKVTLGFTTRHYQWTGSPQIVGLAKDGGDEFTVSAKSKRIVLTLNCKGNSLISIHTATVKPSEFEQTPDSRALGICLDELTIKPDPPHATSEEAQDLLRAKELNPTGVIGSLQVEITSACNLKCRMCINHASTNPRLWPLSAHMDASVWEKLRPALRDAEALVFMGSGEVFTHPNFLPYLEEADGLGVPTDFSTNGQLLVGEVIDRLAALRNLARMAVSVDSPDAEIYERIRGRPLSPVLQGLRDLGRHSTLADRVCVVAVVMRSTLKSLAAFPRQLAEMGIKHLVLRGLFDYDFSLGGEIPAYDTDDVAVLNTIKNECRICGIHLSLMPTIPAELVEVSHDDLHRILRAEDRQNWDGLSGPETKQCFDPWERVVVTRDGSVYPCEAYGQSSGAVGNLKAETFQDIWGGELFTRFRSDLLRGRHVGCVDCVRRQTGPHPLPHYAARILPEGCWSSEEEVNVSVQNIGAFTWTKDARLRVGTSGRRDRTNSTYYHPSWLAPNRVCTFSEERVAPGGTATFSFRISPVKAVAAERFQLLFEERLWLPNTVFHVPFTKCQ